MNFKPIDSRTGKPSCMRKHTCILAAKELSLCAVRPPPPFAGELGCGSPAAARFYVRRRSCGAWVKAGQVGCWVENVPDLTDPGRDST